MIIPAYTDLRKKSREFDETDLVSTDKRSLEGQIFYTLSDENELALLIPLKSSFEISDFSLTDAIRFKKGEYQGQGSWIKVICAYTELEGVFCNFVNAFLDEIEPHRSAYSSLNSVFKDFLSLFDLKNGSKSTSEVAGLIGELLFLRELAQINRDAVAFWVGPSDGQHDFVGHIADVEVKATTRVGKNKVSISSYEQLSNFGERELYLAHYALEKNPSGSIYVQDLVEKIIEKGIAFSEIEPELKKLGCNDFKSEIWNSEKFVLSKAEFFKVTDTFPRIAADQMKDGLLPGVSSVSYQIDLSMARDYIVEPELLLEKFKA